MDTRVLVRIFNVLNKARRRKIKVMSKQKNENQVAIAIVLGIAVVAALYYVGATDFNPIESFRNALPDVVVIKVK